METLFEAADRIAEIEARQDDVLRQLEELERKLDAVLAEYPSAAMRNVALDTAGSATRAA